MENEAAGSLGMGGDLSICWGLWGVVHCDVDEEARFLDPLFFPLILLFLF